MPSFGYRHLVDIRSSYKSLELGSSPSRTLLCFCLPRQVCSGRADQQRHRYGKFHHRNSRRKTNSQAPVTVTIYVQSRTLYSSVHPSDQSHPLGSPKHWIYRRIRIITIHIFRKAISIIVCKDNSQSPSSKLRASQLKSTACPLYSYTSSSQAPSPNHSSGAQ